MERGASGERGRVAGLAVAMSVAPRHDASTLWIPRTEMPRSCAFMYRAQPAICPSLHYRQVVPLLPGRDPARILCLHHLRQQPGAKEDPQGRLYGADDLETRAARGHRIRLSAPGSSERLSEPRAGSVVDRQPRGLCGRAAPPVGRVPGGLEQRQRLQASPVVTWTAHAASANPTLRSRPQTERRLAGCAASPRRAPRR